jgi:novel protein kinase C epsilon type
MIVFFRSETSERIGQPKFSIDSFHPIRILGEEGFGKVVLAKKKASDGSDKSFAIKLLKKSFVISRSCVSFTIIEKEALILTSGQPFITALYTCFQTKVIFSFLNLHHISRESILKFTSGMKM